MSMGIAVVMVMIAIVVLMMVIVAVLMTMTMMIMRLLRRMIVSFACRMRVAGIGATFRIEWRLDLDQAGAQPLHHRLDDVIAPDAQAAARYLRRQVAIAEMPRYPDQMLRVVATNLHQRLRRGHDLDQPAIFEHQRIAPPQRDRVFQIKQKRKAPRARHRHSPPVPIVEIEHHRVGRRFDPTMLSADLRGTDHRTMSRKDGLGIASPSSQYMK
jgi:hypothetical protein